MEESYLRKLITNLEIQNKLLKTRYLKLEDKVDLLLDSEDEIIDEKTLKQFNKLDSQVRHLHQTHISNFETIKILEDKLQEILLEKNEQKFGFEIGNEVTRDIEPTKEEKEKNKFGVAVTYFSLCLIPITILLIIANLIKDFLS